MPLRTGSGIGAPRTYSFWSEVRGGNLSEASLFAFSWRNGLKGRYGGGLVTTTSRGCRGRGRFLFGRCDPVFSSPNRLSFPHTELRLHPSRSPIWPLLRPSASSFFSSSTFSSVQFMRPLFLRGPALSFGIPGKSGFRHGDP